MIGRSLQNSSSASEILKKVTSAISSKKNLQEDDDILELMEEAPSNVPVIEDIKLEPIMDLIETIPEPVKQVELKDKKEPTSKKSIQPMSEKLISENTAEATTAILKELKKQSSQSQTSPNPLRFNSGSTVEALVCELVKPYLKTWLDENLPSIVKNVVEKEVKKLMPSED